MRLKSHGGICFETYLVDFEANDYDPNIERRNKVKEGRVHTSCLECSPKSVRQSAFAYSYLPDHGPVRLTDFMCILDPRHALFLIGLERCFDLLGDGVEWKSVDQICEHHGILDGIRRTNSSSGIQLQGRKVRVVEMRQVE